MVNKRLRKEYCFLTPEANDALAYLQKSGVEDQDFALSILERLAYEEDIYDLEDRSHEFKDRSRPCKSN